MTSGTGEGAIGCFAYGIYRRFRVCTFCFVVEVEWGVVVVFGERLDESRGFFEGTGGE